MIHYTKSLRLLKTLLSSLMDDSEKFMSIYQHQNWLKLIDWDLCHAPQQKDELLLPKFIDNFSKVDSHIENIDKFFAQYLEEQLTARDYRLIKGVFWDEDLTNDELQLIKVDEYEWDESETSISHYIQPVPHASTNIWMESSEDNKSY